MIQIKDRFFERNLLSKLFFIGSLFAIISFVFIHKIDDWRFFDDDYGAIFTAISTKNPATFFFDNHNEKTILPTNQLINYKNYSDVVTFRPLTLFWYWLVAKVLPSQENAQYYFLLSVFLHAFLAALLFLAAGDFLEEKNAFYLSLLFGLFPFQGKFIGRLVIQPYSLGFILNILAYFSQKVWHKNHRFFFIFLAYFLFAISIFLHEIFLSFFFIQLFFFVSQKNIKLNKTSFFEVARFLSIFLLIISGYFILKKIIYPDLLNSGSFFRTFLFKLPNRFYDFVTMFVDIHGYSSIKGGHRLLKIFLLALDANIFCLLFWLARRSFFLWALPFFFYLIQYWPSILIMHVSRYLYFSIPFLFLAIFIAYENSAYSWYKKYLNLVLKIKYLTILTLGALAIPKDLFFLENKFKFVDDNLKEIAKKLEQKSDAKIMGVGLPFDYFPVSGFAQAIWFYSKNHSLQIFYDQFHTIRFSELNNLPNKKFVNFKAYPLSYELFLKCEKSQTAHVLLHNPFGFSQKYGLGEMKILQKNENKAFSILFKIKESFWPEYFIYFDEQKLKLF